MRRKVLIIGVVVVAAGAALVTTLMKDRTSGPDQNSVVRNGNLAITNSTTNTPPTNAAPTEKAERDQILGASRLFAERYGTTFSDNPTAHLASILDASSSALKEALRKSIGKPIPVPDATAVARSFSVTSLDLKRGTADVTVTMQRTEKAARVGATTASFVQSLTLSLVREKTWKVSVAVWGPKQ